MGRAIDRVWLALLLTAVVAALAVKIWLAFRTTGAPDISLWKDFLFHIKECGVCVYDTGGIMQYPGGTRLNPFNHPPFIIHYLRFVDLISLLTGLRFETVFRLLTSLIDLGSAVIVYRLVEREGFFRPWTFLFYLLAPSTIIISGYHGNTDTVMIFFVLLAALMIDRPWLAGIALGMALNIKAVPIIFVPVFFLYLTQKRLFFMAAVAVTVLVGSFPFLFESPLAIVKGVFGYRGFPGRWGWSQALFAVIGPGDLFSLITRTSTYILLAVVALLAIRMWRRSKPSIYFQLGFTAFLFLAFTPAWGTNYLPWLDPFPIVLGLIPSILYYLSSGSLLTYLYFIHDDESTRLMGICWIAVLIVTWVFLRRLKAFEANSRNE